VHARVAGYPDAPTAGASRQPPDAGGSLMQSIDTIVVGGGQAGLASSLHLARRGVDHVVLEAGRIGESWRSRRWDSFTLVTPNWMTALPDLPAGLAAPPTPTASCRGRRSSRC
jgi:cation diffusion facilitator CzcD-associated flavoprotein CzcO